MLEESMKKYAARTAFICMGKSITYGEIDAASRKPRRLAAVARHRARAVASRS
jgi:acyl-CoA synthetase (AMP-forming)/AMP-acid ligase II